MLKTEEIKRHLRELGYENVPDDLAEELAAELDESFSLPKQQQNQSFLSSTSNRSTFERQDQSAYYDISRAEDLSFNGNKNNAVSVGSISKSQVISQLKQLGYSEDDLPEDLVDELVNELQTLLLDKELNDDAEKKPVAGKVREQRPTISSEDLFEPVLKASQQRTPTIVQPTKKQQDYQNVLKMVERQRQQLGEIGENQLRPRSAQSDMKPRQTTTKFSLSSASLSTRNSFSTVLPRKKKDPVSKYHKYKKQWESDNFLRRLDNPTAPMSKEKMFNGIGYYKIMHS